MFNLQIKAKPETWEIVYGLLTDKMRAQRLSLKDEHGCDALVLLLSIILLYINKQINK